MHGGRGRCLGRFRIQLLLSHMCCSIEHLNSPAVAATPCGGNDQDTEQDQRSILIIPCAKTGEMSKT